MDQDERAEGSAVSRRPETAARRTRSAPTSSRRAKRSATPSRRSPPRPTSRRGARDRVDEVKAKAKASTPESGQEVVAKVREKPAPFVLGAAVLVAFLIGRRTAHRE